IGALSVAARQGGGVAAGGRWAVHHLIACARVVESDGVPGLVVAAPLPPGGVIPIGAAASMDVEHHESGAAGDAASGLSEAALAAPTGISVVGRWAVVDVIVIVAVAAVVEIENIRIRGRV